MVIQIKDYLISRPPHYWNTLPDHVIRHIWRVWRYLEAKNGSR